MAGLAVLPTAAAASSGPDTSGATTAIGYLNQQREANGIPAFTTIDNSLASSWCPDESQEPVTENRVLAGSSEPLTFTAGSSPWTAAPLHQVLMYDPLARSAGWATMTDASFDGEGTMPYIACMGFGDEAPDPSQPTAYTFYSELGPDAVQPSIDVQGEGPYSPEQLVGISQGTPTGPQPIFYLLGMGRVRAVSWSLTDTATGAAVPDVSIVTSYQAQAAGDDPDYLWNNGVMITPVLTPATVYDGEAEFTGDGGSCLEETFAFATLQSDGSPAGVDVAPMHASSCSTSKRTALATAPRLPRARARWRRGVFVVKARLRRGERLSVVVHDRRVSSRRRVVRVHGRYARRLVVWVTRSGRSSAHEVVRVRRR